MVTRNDSLLRLINDIGGKGKHRDFCAKIHHYWELTKREKESQTKLFHHVASVEQALKASLLIKHLGGYGGIWEITEAGKKYVSSVEYRPPLPTHRVLSQTETKDDRFSIVSSGKSRNAIISCIESLRVKLERHRKDDLKEYPTRTIFVDPLLEALGWDVRDPDEVQLEYPTIDGKSVDYAPKINRKPILFIEAKSLNDLLTDMKSITQVVGYAANAGVEWCILTNGSTYKVYRSTEKAAAPDKLLFEISLDPRKTEGMSIKQVSEQFARFSRDAMAKGLLDEIGEQIFTTGKIRKVLDKLFVDPPGAFIRLIRSRIGDDTIKPTQVKNALKRLWAQTTEVEIQSTYESTGEPVSPDKTKLKSQEYNEEHHILGKPREVVELFWTIDKFCRELEPADIERKYLAKYVRYSHGKNIFCCVHICNSGIRVWLKLSYSDLESPPEYVRDMSNVGHWGVGDVELTVDSLDRLQNTKSLIKKSFEESR